MAMFAAIMAPSDPSGLDIASKNSAALQAAPLIITHTRSTALSMTEADAERATFSGWVKFSEKTLTKYPLWRVDSGSAGDSYIEAGIDYNNRIYVDIYQPGLPSMHSTSPVASVVNDDSFYHVHVVINFNQAQPERRALVYVDGYEQSMNSINPIERDTALGALRYNSKVRFLGRDETDYFDGTAAACGIVFGQSLVPSYFAGEVGHGTIFAREETQVSPATSDIYIDFDAVIEDEWNDLTLTTN
jgi:hypothetical protein